MKELLANGHEFSLIQAVSLIQKCTEPEQGGGAQLDGGDPLSRIDYHRDPAKERVRFRAKRSLGFPASDIAQIFLEGALGNGHEGERYVIETTCLGLYGPSSPLPDYVNERLMARDRDTKALRDFLDIFNHRLLILLCHILTRYRHSRSFNGKATDELSLYCSALVGEHSPPDNPVNLDRRHLLRNISTVSGFSLSARRLEHLVSDRFDSMPTRVSEFEFCSIEIPEELRFCLGSANNRLGESMLLGDHATACDAKIGVEIEPSDWESFLPDGDGRKTLENLLARVLPRSLAWDLVLRSRPEDTVPVSLGHDGCLARNAWLGRPQREVAIKTVGGG